MVAAGANLGGTGSLTVDAAGTLAVQGTVALPTSVSGVVMGNGHISSLAMILDGGSLRPGNSPGTISLDGGLTLDGNYDWDLNGNDNTMAGGTFDKVKTGGVVTLAARSHVNIMISGGVDFTNAFWSSPESWQILFAPNSFANSTIPGLTVNTSSFTTQYPNGSFALSENTNTELNVNWSPGAVPEPGSAALLGTSRPSRDGFSAGGNKRTLMRDGSYGPCETYWIFKPLNLCSRGVNVTGSPSLRSAEHGDHSRHPRRQRAARPV